MGEILAYARMAPQMEKMLWDLMMFCGRYGHQQVDAMMNWPVTQLYRAAEALADTMKKEGSGGGFHESAASGGA